MSGYSILVIDDEHSYHELIAEYLNRFGFAIYGALDGEEGVARAREKKPDLILLDINMPVMDGFETLSSLKSEAITASIPVIFLSSFNRPNLKVKGLEAGAEDYITKPFDNAELTARIKAAIRRSEKYRRNENALEGNLSDLSIAEILQTLELGQKTGTINLPDIEGSIELSKGKLVSVLQGEFKSSEALNRIILLERGRFSIEFRRESDAELQDGFSAIPALMFAVAYIDEVREMLQKAGGAEAQAKVTAEFLSECKATGVAPDRRVSLKELAAAMEGALKANAEHIFKAIETGVLKLD